MAVFVADEQERRVDTEDLAALARHVMAERHVPAEMELSVLLVDDETMAALNAQHMGGTGATDVLAFPIDEPGESPPAGPAVLGDVVLCPSVAENQAGMAGHDLEAELRLLTVHGILHLLGMDHASPAAERRMFGLTDELLASYASARQ